MYTYIHVIYIYIYIYIQIYVYMYTCIYIYNIYIVCVFKCMHAYIYIYMFICMFKSIMSPARGGAADVTVTIDGILYISHYIAIGGLILWRVALEGVGHVTVAVACLYIYVLLLL